MKKNVSNIVLYACLFEITCITPSGKEHDPLDDKKNMNTSYTMYTLKSKLLKKHTLLHLNIICISTWMVTQKNSIINSMYLYVAYNCIPLTCLVTVTKLRHSTGSLYMNGEQYEVEITNAMFLMSSFTSIGCNVCLWNY